MLKLRSVLVHRTLTLQLLKMISSDWIDESKSHMAGRKETVCFLKTIFQ